jgi:DNA-binding MarR family transcriptional regulator
VERLPCAEDRRATNARLSAHGWALIRAAAPGHVMTVRRDVLDVLTRSQLAQLDAIAAALLTQLDPDRRLAGLYDPTPRQDRDGTRPPHG